jgi:hypothetical protein
MRDPAFAADGRVVVTRDPSADQWIAPNVSLVEHRLGCETAGN